MAIQCPGCGREYDVTLFQLGRTIHCTCGRRVGLEHRLGPPVSTDRPRFIADAMLGRLARWLRTLGYDTAFDDAIRDDELVRRAFTEGRHVLTRDRKLFEEWRIGGGLLLRSDRPLEQMAEVAATFGLVPTGNLFSRCRICNEPLQPVEREAVRTRVPARVWTRTRVFTRCPRCDRVYWEGSHTDRMRSAVYGAFGTEPDPSPVRDADFVLFLQWALPRMGLRWSGFRKVRGQVRKRVGRRLRALDLPSLGDYRAYLQTHPSEWEELAILCRITISRFYRDQGVFRAIRNPVLPSLALLATGRPDRTIRCWSVGCGSGEEPYTVSLAWHLDAAEAAPGVELAILATDVDSLLLARARTACYGRGPLKDLPQDWVRAAFDTVDGSFCLRSEFRVGVTLTRQDVRRDMPPGPFDLILCRNLVFTYFELDLQAALLSRMLERLHRGGYLVLGGHETLPPGSWPLESPLGGLAIHQRVPGPAPHPAEGIAG